MYRKGSDSVGGALGVREGFPKYKYNFMYKMCVQNGCTMLSCL